MTCGEKNKYPVTPKGIILFVCGAMRWFERTGAHVHSKSYENKGGSQI